MPKLYLNQIPNQREENLSPKKETIKFLLDYSKALRVTEYRNLTFETYVN